MAENKKKIDDISGVETTGHEWDGLEELNNPAPRWWLWVFIITVIWSVGYWVIYPAWPVPGGHTQGSLEWTQYKELKESQQEILERKQRYLSRFEGASLHDIRKDPELYQFALAGGAAAFKDNCATCHGTGAEGQGIYPNLNDDDWLWGGTLEEIYQTIKYGIRSTHEDTRYSAMTAFGRENILNRQQIETVADYVLRLASGKGLRRHGGAALYAEHCASCHGAKGQGDISLGAPALNDAIWLYGEDKQSIIETITNARNGVMPHWTGRLDENTLKQLTIFVHSLGGGK